MLGEKLAPPSREAIALRNKTHFFAVTPIPGGNSASRTRPDTKRVSPWRAGDSGGRTRQLRGVTILERPPVPICPLRKEVHSVDRVFD